MGLDFIPLLLGLAVLAPLASFFAIFTLGNLMGGHGRNAAVLAVMAILFAAVCSFTSLGIWVWHHPPVAVHHHDDHHDADHSSHGDEPHGEEHHESGEAAPPAESHSALDAPAVSASTALRTVAHAAPAAGEDGETHALPEPLTGSVYTLGRFGDFRIDISYYIDSLTLCMFCMVTFIASCIHFYAFGYMHDELHDVTDHEVTTSDGRHLHRPGRFHRFFQYLSLFCFSMLGLVYAGNVAMVFVFWELVGICSYFLIGFYVERKSASTAANKAFIVNRVGDFGMILGLMALWGALGTFAFGDIDYKGDGERSAGLFTQIRRASEEARGGGAAINAAPEGMVRLGARALVAELTREQVAAGVTDAAAIENAVAAKVSEWRRPETALTAYRRGIESDQARIAAARESGELAAGWSAWAESWKYSAVTRPLWWLTEFSYGGGFGYWLLIVAGVGIFCGCVGKSAQFPLHTWLPDAMEGPTPVSALVHSATMVAAGVYLVGRFYPVFTAEVLLVIAVVGCITLFMAATIAITATDIKRVLAYSTVSQLGYMMLALGLGGWLAGLMHLVTHAFFKSLLFMCSGSVIHAVHTNEMTEMGGLRKKMPWTAYTMLIGCLAIAGIGIPFVIGFSGYYSKDAILEQACSYMLVNGPLGAVFFWSAAGGAALTAFYMFRLWYMTFAGKPRNQHRYDHAHESPKIMYVPLVILSVLAVGVAWQLPWFIPGSHINLVNLLEQSRPEFTNADLAGPLTAAVWPAEYKSHAWSIKFPVTLLAIATALGGIALATLFYGTAVLNPGEVRERFHPLYRFLRNKWWFDELYDWVFVKPTLVLSRFFAAIDREWIDRFLDGLAVATRRFAGLWDALLDRGLVDGTANRTAEWAYALGLSLRQLQTGRLRQYVMFIVIGTLTIFILVSFFWQSSLAGG